MYMSSALTIASTMYEIELHVVKILKAYSMRLPHVVSIDFWQYKVEVEVDIAFRIYSCYYFWVHYQLIYPFKFHFGDCVLGKLLK